MKNKVNYKLINIALILVIIYLIYLIRDLWIGLVAKVLAVSFPFLLAFVVAYALYPFVKKLTNIGAPKWLATTITCIVAFGTLVATLVLAVPLLYDQIILFLGNISTLIGDISSKFDLNLGQLQSSFSEISTNIVSKLGTYVSDGAINIVSSSISIATNFIIVLFVSIYLLKDMDKIRDSIKRFFKKRKNRSYRYVTKLDTEITNYFTGLGLNILVQFVEYTFVFLLIGHPNYLILGILASVTTIIPYFGALLCNVLALLIASVISTKLFVLTVIVLIVCPQLDGYLIGPKIYGKTNKINPVVNIFAVFAGGVLAGFWGIVCALPVAIAIKATLEFFKEDITDKIVEIKEKVEA